MKHKKTAIAIVALVAVAAVGSAAAYAFPGHRHGGMGLMALRAVLQPNQRDQVEAIFEDERPTLKGLHEQMRQARQALADKLFSAKNVEVGGEVGCLKRAEAAMVDEHVKIALKIRTLLSPEQLTKVGEIRASVRALHERERALLMPQGAPGAMREPATEQ